MSAEKLKCPECAEYYSYSSIKGHCYKAHGEQYDIVCDFCGDKKKTSSIYYHFMKYHKTEKYIEKEILEDKEIKKINEEANKIQKEIDEDEAEEKREREEKKRNEEKERKEKTKTKPYLKYLSDKKVDKLASKINARHAGLKPKEEAEEVEEEAEEAEEEAEEKAKEQKEQVKNLKKLYRKVNKRKTLAIVAKDLRICGVSDEEIVKSIDDTIENLKSLKNLILEKKTKRVKSLNENNYIYKLTKTMPINKKNLNINLTFQNVVNNYIDNNK